MYVESVNVGKPLVAEWKGRRFSTGIVKSPVVGSVALEGINLAGDDQADRSVHGGPDKAVYAYSREDIDWWAQTLGRRIAPGGDFGENLTTVGIDLAEAIIGERWRVGTVVLEVSEPRVPCFKLAMRMNDASFPKKFSAALRTGTYFRIIEEGAIAAGDAIVVSARPEHGLSVAAAARIYLFDHGSSSRFLEAPQLSEKWRSWARKVATLT
jgi:MOSC domain-containing protein YiiM